MTRSEAVAFLEKEHSELKQTVKRIRLCDLRQFVSGSWTVKDILGHFSAWNNEETNAMDTILRGDKEFISQKTQKL